MGAIACVGRIAVIAASLLAMAAAATAQGNRFEGKVPFKIDTSAPLTAVVGPVKVTNLKITNMGRGYGRGGLSFRSASPPSELSTTLRFAFDVDNPAEEEWDVTFTVELVDKSGKVIDRGSKTENYEEEAKVLNLDHAIIEYVLPMIAEVRVTLQGRRS
jgi:hypothetical protein